MALTEEMFLEKLNKLSNTQQGIENMSSWCCFWRNDARRIVQWWEEAFSRADKTKRLTMIYLANDVLQNSRRKGPEFIAEFYRVIPRALRPFLSKADDKTKTSVNKVLKIWEDRKVFGKSGSKTVHQLIEEAGLAQEGPPPVNGDDDEHQQRTSVKGASIEALMRKAEQESDQVKKLNALVEQNNGVAPDEEQNGEGSNLLEGLSNYHACLLAHKETLEELRTVLNQAVQMQDNAINEVATAIAACEVRIAAVRQLNTNSMEKSATGVSNTEGQTDVQNPSAVQASVIEAGVASESARVAAQVMANPGALLEALAAALPVHGKQEAMATHLGTTAGGSPAQAEEEYDPEDPF